MKRKTILLIIVSILSAIMLLFGAYVYFGGFNEVKVVPLESASFRIQGKLFEGNARDADMGERFSETDKLLQSSGSSEKLIAYFYNAPNEEEGYKVKVFIGATFTEEQKLDEAFEVKQFNLKKCLRAQHKSHPIITGVYSAAFAYAEEKNLTLDSAIAIEHYPTRDSLVLWVPVSENENASL